MRQGEKYSKFSAYFLSNFNREFNDDQIVQEYSNYDAVEIDGLDDNLLPHKQSKLLIAGSVSFREEQTTITYENLSDFLDNIQQKTIKEHNAKAIVYMHILNYHAPCLIQFLGSKGYHHTIENKKFRSVKIGYKQIDLLSNNGKIFHVSFYGNGIFIKFQDSEKIIPKTAKQLATELQIPRDFVPVKEIKYKINHDYSQQLLDFVKNECKIVKTTLLKFQQTEDKATKLTNETLGGIAYDYVRDIIKEKNPKFTIRDFNYWLPYLASPMNFPSFTAGGKWIHKPKCIDSIDLNSAYGATMCGLLPHGKWHEKPLKSGKNYCCFMKIRIISARIKKKYESTAFIFRPFIYNSKGEKYAYLQENINIDYGFVQKVENKIYFVLDFELEQGKRTYDMEYEVLKRHYFQTSNYLEPIIRQIYKYGDIIAKRMIVTIFGKIGQKYRKCIDYYGKESDIDKTKFTIIAKRQTFTDCYKLEEKYNLDDDAKPVFVQAYIIAAVRTKIITKIADIIDRGYEVIYNDTDMITYINDINNPLVLDDIGTQIGQGKYEFREADAFCCLCPKHYRVIKNGKLHKHATSGISRELMAKVLNQDYNYDIGSNPKYKIMSHYFKTTKGGRTLINKTFNFHKGKAIKKNPVCPKELYQ